MAQSSAARQMLNKIGKYAGNAGGAIRSVPHKLRGAYYDTQRGNLLYKKGYGKHYDSALTVARKGKSNKDRH